MHGNGILKMTKFSINKDWDQLQSCVIGTVPEPDFFSNIKNSSAREALETVVYETEQDFQYLMQSMMSFGVQIWRPNLPLNSYMNKKYVAPLINPRDVISVVDSTLYYQKNTTNFDFTEFYQNVKDITWPDCFTLQEFYSLPTAIKDECINLHGLIENVKKYEEEFGSWNKIFNYIQQQETKIKETEIYNFSSSMVISAGNVKLFAVNKNETNINYIQELIDIEFPNTVNYIIRTNKRLSEICAIPCEGLIICAENISELKNIFKDWEIIVADTDYEYKKKWAIKDIEVNDEISNIIETQFQLWTYDATNLNSAVDMLVLDDKNVIINTSNETVLKKLQSYNITPHIVSFSHKSFWGIGIRNSTADLFRSPLN
jgi:hypothetical protein